MSKAWWNSLLTTSPVIVSASLCGFTPYTAIAQNALPVEVIATETQEKREKPITTNPLIVNTSSKIVTFSPVALKEPAVSELEAKLPRNIGEAKSIVDDTKASTLVVVAHSALDLKSISTTPLNRVAETVPTDGVWLPNNQSAKSELNKSLLDAAHGQFIQVLKFVAWKLGKAVVEVNPKGTSQHCWNCLNEVKKELKDRWHSCSCGEECHRDENSGKLIKKLGIVGMDIASLKTALGLTSKRSPRSTRLG